jgi:hypothetical protein
MAQPRCEQEDPALGADSDDPRHLAACHFAFTPAPFSPAPFSPELNENEQNA